MSNQYIKASIRYCLDVRPRSNCPRWPNDSSSSKWPGSHYPRWPSDNSSSKGSSCNHTGRSIDSTSANHSCWSIDSANTKSNRSNSNWPDNCTSDSNGSDCCWADGGYGSCTASDTYQLESEIPTQGAARAYPRARIVEKIIVVVLWSVEVLLYLVKLLRSRDIFLIWLWKGADSTLKLIYSRQLIDWLSKSRRFLFDAISCFGIPFPGWLWKAPDQRLIHSYR